MNYLDLSSHKCVIFPRYFLLFPSSKFLLAMEFSLGVVGGDGGFRGRQSSFPFLYQHSIYLADSIAMCPPVALLDIIVVPQLYLSIVNISKPLVYFTEHFPPFLCISKPLRGIHLFSNILINQVINQDE